MVPLKLAICDVMVMCGDATYVITHVEAAEGNGQILLLLKNVGASTLISKFAHRKLAK